MKKKHPILMLGLLASLNAFSQTPTGYGTGGTPLTNNLTAAPMPFNPQHFTTPTAGPYSIDYLNALIVGDPNGNTGTPSNLTRLTGIGGGGVWRPFQFSMLQAYGGTVTNQNDSRSGVASMTYQNGVGIAYGTMADASYQNGFINSTFGMHGEHFFDATVNNPGLIFTAGGAFRNNLTNASEGLPANQINAGVIGMLANQPGNTQSAFNVAVFGFDETRNLLPLLGLDDLNNPGANYAGGFLGRGYFSNRVGIGLAGSGSEPEQPSAMLHIDGTGVPGIPATAIADGRILRLVGLRQDSLENVLVIDDSGYVRTQPWPTLEIPELAICTTPNNVGHSNGNPNTIVCGRIWDNATNPAATTGNVGINTPSGSPFATLTGTSTLGFVRTDGRFQMNGIGNATTQFSYVGIVNGTNEVVRVPPPTGPVTSCSWELKGNDNITSVARGTIGIPNTVCAGNSNNFIGTRSTFVSTGTPTPNDETQDLVFATRNNGWMRLTTEGGLFLTDRTISPDAGNIKIGRFAGNSAAVNSLTVMGNIFVGQNTARTLYNGLGFPRTSENIIMGNSAAYNGNLADTQFISTRNTIIGHIAAQRINQTGPPDFSGQNVIIGFAASRNLTTAGRNVVIGAFAGGTSDPNTNNNTVDFTGIDNTLIGYQAGTRMSTGRSNTIMGFASGSTLTTGQRNIIMGASSGTMTANTSGNANVVIGDNANAPGAAYDGVNLTQNSTNVYIGAAAGVNNIGNGNTFLGFSTGNNNGGPFQGNNNTFIGNRAASSLTVPQGSDNVSIGRQSSSGAGYGSNNVSIGSLSGNLDNGAGLDGNSNKDNTISIGYINAVQGDNAISIGSQIVGGTVSTNASGVRSIAIGTSAGSTGLNSIAIGTSAQTTWGHPNSIALGRNTYTNGPSSIAIGDSARCGNGGGTGPNNIAIGTKAFATGNPRGSIAIGNNAQVHSYNSVAIGNDAIIGNNNWVNTMVLGNSITGTGAPSLKVGLGTFSPTTTFHVDCRRDTKYGAGTKIPTSKSAIRFDSLQAGEGNVLVIAADGYVYRSAYTPKSTAQASPQTDSLLRHISTLEQRLSLLEKDMDKCCMKVGAQGSSQRVPMDENIKLYQNVPNPFTEGTEIKFYLPESVQRAYIAVYDLQGKEIRKMDLHTRGESSIRISGHELAAGMYIYALVADNQEVDSKRMILTSY